MALSPSQEYFPYGTVELSRANGPKFKVEYGHPRQAHFWRELPTLGLPGIVKDTQFFVIHQIFTSSLHWKPIS
ncbi:hypothetical protein Tco_1352621 [Tanacetum coccineum]